MSIPIVKGGCVIKKHMRKTMALLLSASLVSGMCISYAAAENDPGDKAGQTEVSTE